MKHLKKTNEKNAIVIGQIAVSCKPKRRRNEQKWFKILLDSGAAGNAMSNQLVFKHNATNLSHVTHATANGNYSTSTCTNVQFTML